MQKGKCKPIWKCTHICQSNLTFHLFTSSYFALFLLPHKSLHVRYHITPCLLPNPQAQTGFLGGPMSAAAQEQSHLGEVYGSWTDYRFCLGYKFRV